MLRYLMIVTKKRNVMVSRTLSSRKRFSCRIGHSSAAAFFGHLRVAAHYSILRAKNGE
jgi:hypothetical protein